MTGNPHQIRSGSDSGNAPDVVLEKPFRLEQLLSSLEGCLCPS
jgi:hypothetical protein